VHNQPCMCIINSVVFLFSGQLAAVLIAQFRCDLEAAAARDKLISEIIVCHVTSIRSYINSTQTMQKTRTRL